MTSNEIPAKLTHDHGVVSIFLCMSLVLLLLTASFAAISITFSPAFGYYSTSSTANLSISKEIPDQVKNFIINQVVNKSKAAIIVGFVDPNGTRVFSFGNMSTTHNMPVNQSTIFHMALSQRHLLHYF